MLGAMSKKKLLKNLAYRVRADQEMREAAVGESNYRYYTGRVDAWKRLIAELGGEV